MTSGEDFTILLMLILSQTLTINPNPISNANPILVFNLKFQFRFLTKCQFEASEIIFSRMTAVMSEYSIIVRSYHKFSIRIRFWIRVRTTVRLRILVKLHVLLLMYQSNRYCHIPLETRYWDLSSLEVCPISLRLVIRRYTEPWRVIGHVCTSHNAVGPRDFFLKNSWLRVHEE